MDLLAYRVLSWKVSLRKALIDDGHLGCIWAILLLKRTAAAHRGPNHTEIRRCDRAIGRCGGAIGGGFWKGPGGKKWGTPRPRGGGGVGDDEALVITERRGVR